PMILIRGLPAAGVMGIDRSQVRRFTRANRCGFVSVGTTPYYDNARLGRFDYMVNGQVFVYNWATLPNQTVVPLCRRGRIYVPSS
ncbi:MAG: hypothetical protein F6K28_37225, partial [Microcoleus sp. SIO2G3]|nr:hypothetical protein [Microcoleus sp. SIO2G3]